MVGKPSTGEAIRAGRQEEAPGGGVPAHGVFQPVQPEQYRGRGGASMLRINKRSQCLTFRARRRTAYRRRPRRLTGPDDARAKRWRNSQKSLTRSTV